MEKYGSTDHGAASIENKLELENINAAKKLGIYTVTFLDHWTNYKKGLNKKRLFFLMKLFILIKLHFFY